MAQKENAILDMSFDFSLDVIKTYQQLIKDKEFILSKQFLRSGTSIGANVNEAQAAQSKADFVSKMAIASKEARETKYWIDLLAQSGYINKNGETEKLNEKINSIINILTKIVKTTQFKKC